MCTVRRQDGRVCGSWSDKHVSDVCDYHVQDTVQPSSMFARVVQFATISLACKSESEEGFPVFPFHLHTGT